MGKIAEALHGKRGEINGALLENGTIIRLPPPQAERMQALLQAGQMVAVRGNALTSSVGTVVDAAAIGSAPDQLPELSVPPPSTPQPPASPPRRRPGGPAEFAPPPPPPPPPPRG